MAQPSALLQALLSALSSAKQGTTLVLDTTTIGATTAAPLLDLFSSQLQISSFTLDNVQLPSSVTDDTLTISGASAGVTLTLTFQDIVGEIAIQALLQASDLSTLETAFPALGSSFFGGITVSGSTASVTVPGLGPTLAFSSPIYGVVGLATPNSGLVTTSIAPRVDGQASPPSGAKPLFVELQTATSGYRIGPLAQPWSFTDFGWLLPALNVLAAFPSIIPNSGLDLDTFDLNLYPQAPSFSSVSFEVADATDPSKPLWSALGGKIQLSDVVVSLDLVYSEALAISLAGTGSVTGNFVLGTVPVDVQIPFPLSGVWSLSAYPNLSLTVLDDIASLLDGGSSQLDGLMPANLSALGNFELTYVQIAVDASNFSLVGFTFAVGSTATWPLVPKAIELSSLQMQLTVQVPSGGGPTLTGSVVGIFSLPHDSQIVVSFGRTTALQPWHLDVISPAIALPGLGDLAQLTKNADLASMVRAGGLDQLHFVMTNLNIGITFGPTSLTNLGLTLQLVDAANPINPTLDWELIPGVLTLTEFAFGFQLTFGATTTKTVFGTFVMNGLEFDVKFAQQTQGGGTTDALIAEYSAQGSSGTVDIKQLVNSISPSVAQGLPDGLVIDLADAMLAYLNSGGTKKYVFAMEIGVTMPLSDLPLVGKALPTDAQVQLKNLKVVVASAELSADDVAFINALSPTPVLPTPAANTTGAAIPAGFSMVGELQLGSLSILMSSPPAQQQSQLAALPGEAPAADPVMWINVQKTFGPVSIQKVGFSYQSGKLFVLSNLALTTGSLEIDLIGIGIGSAIQNPSPAFTIQGLAVSLTAGPVAVMGGMIGTLDPLNFVGALSVRAPEFALAAFAGYANYESHPSFFLYGVLDAPIGGVPAFFITGVAAGIGFNRALVLPDVSGVATFPLVAWATGSGTPSMDPTKPIGDQVGDVLTKLVQAGVVAPSVGTYWFAAGLQFTSFELLDSFALLTVILGTDVEIALLGLSTLTIPPDDPEPVAEVQLAIEVAFSYDKGLLAIAGQLTPNSYVLSRACRLTGGFAFYLWFRGEHTGETVVSLGGYNPNFTVPSYYPVVPRLGLNWQVIPELTITGGLYFAVTSNVVMAGGKLSAVWSSGPIRAWFTYWADFLIQFTPFHYYVDGGIDLGASFTVHLLFVSFSITIHIGVGIAIWGPEFAGRATVDLSIVSFTISFGDQTQQTDTSIGWSSFVQQLLPAQPAQTPQPRLQRARAQGRLAARRRRRLAGADPTPPPAAVVQITVVGGLIRTLDPTPANPWYLVNGETFQCAVLMVIPCKQVTFATDPLRSGYANLSWAPVAQQPHDGQGNPIVPNTDFGSRPANLPAASFQPALTLSLSTQEDSTLQAVQQFTNAPLALWASGTSYDAHGVPQIDPATGLTQSTIPNALTGLSLIPPAVSHRLLPVPIDSLLFDLTDVRTFAWSLGVPPTTDTFSGQTVAGTIDTPTVPTVRSELLGSLAALGIAVDTTVNVTLLANQATTDLESEPRLRLLGEQTAA